jgi:hypothetical protein
VQIVHLSILNRDRKYLSFVVAVRKIIDELLRSQTTSISKFLLSLDLNQEEAYWTKIIHFHPILLCRIQARAKPTQEL